MARDIRWRLHVAWSGSYVSGDIATDSARIISARGNHTLTAPGISMMSGRGMIAECTIDLDNSDGRYSSTDPAGALYSYINAGQAHHRPMYLEISIDGGTNYYTVFRGVILQPKEQTSAPGSARVVTLVCRTLEERYLNHRISTQLTQFRAWVEDPPTEAEIIEKFLTDAGVSAGDMALDSGLFRIQYAWMDDESPIEEAWALAAACGGRFYYESSAAKFVYENAAHWLLSPHDTASTSGPDNTLGRGDYASASVAWDADDLFTSITAEYSGRRVGESTVAWSPDEQVTVPADGTVILDVTFQQPLYAVDTISLTAANAGGRTMTADITATLSDVFAQRATLTLVNANTVYAANVHDLVIGGRPIVGGPEGEVTRTTSDAWWSGRTPRKRSLRGSVYVQTPGHAAALADMMLDLAESPRLTYKVGGIPGDPRRKIGDRLTMTDSALMGTEHRDAFVTALTWKLDGFGFVQDVDAVDAYSLFAYAETPISYFIIGTNKLGDGAPGYLYGRLFY